MTCVPSNAAINTCIGNSWKGITTERIVRLVMVSIMDNHLSQDDQEPCPPAGAAFLVDHQYLTYTIKMFPNGSVSGEQPAQTRRAV